MIRVVALVAGVLIASTAIASAAPPPRSAQTGASAVLVRITVPGQDTVSLGELAWPISVSADVQSFQYPADGSILSVGRSRAAISAQTGEAALAQSFAEAIVLSVFGGEIVAGKVSASVSAGASSRSAGAKSTFSEVHGLRVLGRDVAGTPGATVLLEDWGTLTVLTEETGSRRAGPPAARGSVIALRIRLSAAHGELPAGSEIVVGSAEATAVATPGRGPTRPPEGSTSPERPAPDRPASRAPEPDAGGESIAGGPVRVAPEISANLSAGGFVFPIFGPASFGDSFGGPRPNIEGGWHHGEDLFAPLGTPVLAVADGTLHTIGFTPIGGYRMWLRDAAGNEFYYAHLSAFSPLAVDGRSVEAGDVIGFVGDTGDAAGGSPHLHFEIHPASMLALGYDGVIAPYPILLAWRRAEDISFSAGRLYVPTGSGVGELPPPGAVLLQADDIASTSGLVPGALESALGG